MEAPVTKNLTCMLGLSLIAMVPLAVSAQLEERYPFPASNAPGAGSAYFITTVDILNDDDDPARIRLQLLERDADNSSALESAEFVLARARSVVSPMCSARSSATKARTSPAVPQCCRTATTC
jgi:hypothetical protein